MTNYCCVWLKDDMEDDDRFPIDRDKNDHYIISDENGDATRWIFYCPYCGAKLHE